MVGYGALGYVGGFFLSIQLIPQIIKTWRQKDASQLSYVFMGCNWIGLGCMTTYGVLNRDPPLYVPAGLSFMNTSVLICVKLYVDRIKVFVPII